MLQCLALAGFSNGWHITTRYFSIPHDESATRVEEVFLYKGFMRMEIGALTTIFSIEKGEITYINHTNKMFWQGKPQRFLQEVRAELEASIEEKLVGVNPANRAEMRAMYMEMIDASFQDNLDNEQYQRSFTVEKQGVGMPVANYNTQRYGIFENGVLLETILLAPDLPIAQEFDFVSLSHFLSQLAPGAYGASFESSQEYFSLLQQGYPVRVDITRGDGSVNVSEVVSAKRYTYKPSDFEVPSDYQFGSLTSVGVWEGFL